MAACSPSTTRRAAPIAHAFGSSSRRKRSHTRQSRSTSRTAPSGSTRKNPVGKVPVLEEDYRAVFDGDTAEALDAELAKLDSALTARPFLGGTQFSLADIAYVPWIIRAEARAGVDLGRHENLRGWLGRLAERPSIAAELEVVAAIAT
jgi:glutathione S-transferase